MADYHHSMEREYFKPTREDIQTMGMSTPPFEHQLHALKARIRQGMNVVELGFTGAGKGSMGGRNTTPEMYGKDEREAIRELAQVNNVELSTHATTGVMGFSGLTEGGFNYQRSEQTLHEVQRAIDFAADTARGGAIVMHTGEWQRPVHEADDKFLGHPHAKEDAQIQVARHDTGKIAVIPKKEPVWEPVVKEYYTDEHGNPTSRVKEYEYNDDGTIKLQKKYYDDIVKEDRERFADLQDKPDEVIFLKHYFKAQEENAHAEHLRFSASAQEHQKDLDKIKRAREWYEERWERATDEEKLKMRQELPQRYAFVPPEVQDPINYLKEKEDELAKQINWQNEAALGYGKQAEKVKYEAEQYDTLANVGLQRSADTIARAAMYAFRKEQQQGLDKPLFVAPESWLPEYWSGHPQEMKKLVLESREEMKKRLVQEQHMNEHEAQKVADAHIRTTFDIGHAYTWRKHFKPDNPNMTEEEKDKAVHKWIIEQVKDLNKHNIIGHIHLSDNFGYDDEHVTPGYGTAPIKEFVAEMKKHMKETGQDMVTIVEPAHQDVKAFTGALEFFNTPIRHVGKWSDIQSSYWGKTEPAYFSHQGITPIQQEWQTSYFGVPFE